MASYHVADFAVELVDLSCFHQSDERVPETVKFVSFVGMMPVVKIEIMKKAAGDERFIIDFPSVLPAHAVGKDGYSDGVVIDGIASMGYVFLHALVFRICDDG